RLQRRRTPSDILLSSWAVSLCSGCCALHLGQYLFSGSKILMPQSSSRRARDDVSRVSRLRAVGNGGMFSLSSLSACCMIGAARVVLMLLLLVVPMVERCSVVRTGNGWYSCRC